MAGQNLEVWRAHPLPVRWVQPERSRERRETRRLRGPSELSPRPSQFLRLRLARRLRLLKASKLVIFLQPCRFTSTILLKPAAQGRSHACQPQNIFMSSLKCLS